ncbi:MAG: thiamine pyrophosphate-dependent enzyme [Ignavibacteria bacterium]|nr:thiamine pyrophosphate-dependent enzyme [Ignavibacteria bacterium]
MQKLVLLGDEAIAQGAIDGGLSGIYAYPGTPSTEITEYVLNSKQARELNIHSEWTANEKTAMEAALGMSYAGKRSMTCMKHVGLNVAADPFMNSAMTGVNGGMLIVAADDPSMHSSQNEQDSRVYGNFALLPVLEPANQQECYDMAYEGLRLSEQFGIPVLIRLTTRLAHSRAVVCRRELIHQRSLSLPQSQNQFILLPAYARNRYKKLLALQPEMTKHAESSKYNEYIDGLDKSLGIVACGIAYNYLLENFENLQCPYPIVKIGQYPLPDELLTRLAQACSTLLVLEDGYPVVEDKLKGYYPQTIIVKGRLDGTLPRDGELNPDVVAVALGNQVRPGIKKPDLVANRPPELCSGCGHRDMFDALNEAMAEFIGNRAFSDIGCYTLGALAPYNSICSCVDMGASITMAKGAADAGLSPSVAVIGDSTFTHSGLTGLLDCVNSQSPVTIIISDNETTGMTGGQDSAAFQKLESMCAGIGVEPEHLHVVIPLKKNHEEMVSLFKQEFAYQGVSVIIARRECIQTLSRRKKAGKAE